MPSPPPMQLLALERLTPDHSWRHAADHRHDFHELIYVLEGRYELEREDGGTLWGGIGDCFVHLPGHHHRARWQSGPATACLQLQWRMAPCDHLLPHRRDDDGAILGLLMRMERCLRQGHASDLELLPHLLPVLVHDLRDAHAGPGQVDNRVQRVLNYARHHLAERLSLEELAAVAAVSSTYLIRLFRRELGVTPARQLRRERVAAARVWLREHDEPFTRIARRVGLGSAAQFSRIVKQETGLTPSAIRAGARCPAQPRRSASSSSSSSSTL